MSIRTIFFLVITVATGCAPVERRSSGSLQANAQAFFESVYGCADSKLSELAHPDVKMSYPIFEERLGVPVLQGLDAIREFSAGFCRRWGDPIVTVDEAVSDSERVVLVWEFAATDLSSGEGAGSRRSWGGISFFRFDAEGRVSEEFGEESSPGPVARMSQTIEAPTNSATAAEPEVPYGANASAGNTFLHDGVTFYYETYGAGQPLLLVHGNGGSIGTMAAQIDFFKHRYQVIAMDSRDQGRSSDSDGPITYEKMADDLAALIDHLELGSVHVVGWSDGGIEALLLGLRHPGKVMKLVAMAANLSPGMEAIYPETEEMARAMLASIPENVRSTPEGKRELKVSSIMLEQPNIDPGILEEITAPTLVMAGDHDVIRTEHTVEIFNHLPNAQLAIFPNSTHMLPFDDPELFNTIIDRFLQRPFVKKDRIGDMIESYGRLLEALPQ